MYRHNKEQGFTLVEMMIGIMLMLVILAAVISLFVSSKAVYRTDSEFARIQENGRYAIDALQRNIRMAGYSGCRTLMSIAPAVIANNPPDFASIEDAIVGWDSGIGWANPTGITHVAGTDVVRINHAAGVGTKLGGDMSANSANILLNANPDRLEAGDLVYITDCQRADLFRATGVSQNSGQFTITHDGSTNTTSNLSKAYSETAQVMTFESSLYFVGLNPDGVPALYWLDLDSVNPAVELVSGIQDLQLIYEVDTNGDLVPDDFRDASAVTDWGAVLGVRIGMLLRTENNVGVEVQAITFNGTNGNPSGDLRLRKAFWSSVGIRNRLP